MITQAAVLVGGKGTRLGTLTARTPKPLLDVAGRPFVLWLVDELRRYGVTDILLLAGYMGDQVRELAQSSGGVRVIVENEPLGTGGCLRSALEQLADRFLVLNGDSLFDLNLLDLALTEREATLALREVDDAQRFGTVHLDGEWVRNFNQAPKRSGPGLINGGVGVFSRSVVAEIPEGRAFSIEGELYPRLASAGRLSGRIYRRPFIDIGVPTDYSRAQTFIPRVSDRGIVIFSQGCLDIDVKSNSESDLGFVQQIPWRAVKAINDAGLLAGIALSGRTATASPSQVEKEALRKAANLRLRPLGAQIDIISDEPEFSKKGSLNHPKSWLRTVDDRYQAQLLPPKMVHILTSLDSRRNKPRQNHSAELLEFIQGNMRLFQSAIDGFQIS